MISDSVVKQIENKYQHLSPLLNERSRRLWAATEADALGYGGILALHRATGLSQNTIRAGLKELSGDSTELAPERIRQVGGGRKRVEEAEASILSALDNLVEPTSRGDPECPLRWTCKSSVHTLRKDLVTLRQYGILERTRYDWGYYLGTGAMNQTELQLALNALRSQATYQGDSQARRIYEMLCQRLKSLNLDRKGELFYPVRAHFNRSIVLADPEEMMRKQQYRDTLFHRLEPLEQAIVQGLPIELYLCRTPYDSKATYRQIYPLQLLYYDIAWYLVMEDCANGHLAISRMDRFKPHLKSLASRGRGLDAQQVSLQLAHQLLQNGWGLHLGNPDEQQQERQGTIPLISVKVRFFPPVSRFIAEGDRRHPRQQIVLGPVATQIDEPAYLDYRVKLPERSLNEFSFWVYRYQENAQVLAPPELVEKHRRAANTLALRYNQQN